MTNHILKWGDFKLDLSASPCIMGILNTTPDSFSDGGNFLDPEAAVAQGLQMVKEGADILDIGGESSRPFTEPVSAEEEMARIIPVIKRLKRQIRIPISVDTTKSMVARAALDAGASMINDISAGEHDPAIMDLAAENNIPIILMHMKGSPKTMQIKPLYDDVVKEVAVYLAGRAESAMAAGVAREKIILDPGIGFGKTVEHNLLLTKKLQTICQLGFPVLVGPSRKSFIQKILTDGLRKKVISSSPETRHGTLAAVAVSFMNGAKIIRVHDVAPAKALTQIIQAIQMV